MSLDTLLQLFKKKFKQYEVFHVIKSLTYFEDAEQYPNPILFDESITWTKVKSSVTQSVRKFLK